MDANEVGQSGYRVGKVIGQIFVGVLLAMGLIFIAALVFNAV